MAISAVFSLAALNYVQRRRVLDGYGYGGELPPPGAWHGAPLHQLSRFPSTQTVANASRAEPAAWSRALKLAYMREFRYGTNLLGVRRRSRAWHLRERDLFEARWRQCSKVWADPGAFT
jgi:hypothetical protein